MIERFKKLTVIFGASAVLIASYSFCATSIVASATNSDEPETDEPETDEPETDEPETEEGETEEGETEEGETEEGSTEEGSDNGDGSGSTAGSGTGSADVDDDDLLDEADKVMIADLILASKEDEAELWKAQKIAWKKYENTDFEGQVERAAWEKARDAYNDWLKENRRGTNNDSSDSSSSQEEDNDEPEEATPAEISEPEPTIGSSGAGWSSMSDEVNQAIANATKAAMEAIEAGTEVGTDATAVVSVNLNGTDTVPASAISAIAGKDVVLNLSVSTTMSVNINGSSLNASDVGDIKLSSETDTNGTSTLSVRAENSDINKSIDVFYKVGEANIGGNAVLNFVNADGSLVEFRNSIVYDNGYAAFTTPLVSANYKMSLK